VLKEHGLVLPDFLTTAKRKYQARLVLSAAEVKVSQNLRSVVTQLNTNKQDGSFLKIGNT
jgi:hypothetical protein